MIATVKIDDVEYGTNADFDFDTSKIFIRNLNSKTKIWKCQSYKTRNGREMFRRIRVSPIKNPELHQAVIHAFKVKYDKNRAA
jgi:hypothetical protein